MLTGLPSTGFTTRIAVALGNITIVGGALSNFVFNVNRRHSFFNRPLIDWDLILVGHLLGIWFQVLCQHSFILE